MAATIALPAPEATASRAAQLHDAWSADPQMPDVAGSLADAARVLAVRAAVAETAGIDEASTLAAPPVVEMSVRLLGLTFPEVHEVVNRTGHTFVAGAEGIRWSCGGYLDTVYAGAFGPAGGRHWPA